MTKVQIGLLGAARIAPAALIHPSREVPETEVVAVAARDGARAKHFAERYGVPQVHESYEALLADPGIDAVYIPVPNGLHGRWTIAAIAAGKHVLCEKPFTANAEEAERVAATARRSDRVVMEAFHYRYHALTARMLEIVASGELGVIRRIEAWLCFPLLVRDIRWDLALAGGALMDAGCYAVHILRTLAGTEPVVRSARAKLKSPGVDRLLHAELEFADGRTGCVTASMLSSRLLGAGARVIGSDATMSVVNPVAPHYWHSLTVRSGRARRKIFVEKRPSTYTAQLRAFAGAVLRGEPFPTHVDDAVANMRVIDACYEVAGMKPRQPTH